MSNNRESLCIRKDSLNQRFATGVYDSFFLFEKILDF
jgi:hypothetical protein